MTGYRIARWNECFENSKTRILKNLTWVPFPNKHDGDGYTEIVMDHPNGAAHYGVWCVLVQVASKCDPRGTLVRDGCRPHDTASLSRKTRLPAAIIAEAIPRLVSIEWLETWHYEGTEVPPSGTRVGDEGKGREGNRIEGKGREEKGRGGKEEGTAPPSPLVVVVDAFKKAANWDGDTGPLLKHLEPIIKTPDILKLIEEHVTPHMKPWVFVDMLKDQDGDIAYKAMVKRSIAKAEKRRRRDK